MAFSLLIIHWILTVIWGIALNNSGGYHYCRIVMPDPFAFYHGDLYHSFTIIGIAGFICLGIADRKLLGLSNRKSFYPLVLFLITQILLTWLNLISIRWSKWNAIVERLLSSKSITTTSLYWFAAISCDNKTQATIARNLQCLVV